MEPENIQNTLSQLSGYGNPSSNSTLSGERTALSSSASSPPGQVSGSFTADDMATTWSTLNPPWKYPGQLGANIQFTNAQHREILFFQVGGRAGWARKFNQQPQVRLQIHPLDNRWRETSWDDSCQGTHHCCSYNLCRHALKINSWGTVYAMYYINKH